MRKKNKNHIDTNTTAGRVFDVFNNLLMVALIFVTLYPLYYVVMCSVSDPKLLLAHEGPLAWWLGEFTLEGYELALNNPNILVGFGNTMFNLIVGTVLNMTFSILAAFVLTRKYFYLRNVMMKMMIFTMFFSGGLIPLFFVVKHVGVYNTRWANTIPYLISTYNVIIMRSFFVSLPDSLEEAALIDGASDTQILMHIVLPLSKPVLAVIGLYYAVGHWNSWFPSMVFIRNTKLYTLQYVLRGILITNSMSVASGDNVLSVQEISFASELVKYCTIIVSTVPIMCVYPFLTKYFEKGVMIGAVKG
ncbi:MAG: carbohydrate ABC transporter permease [Clostridia bacterium]|nr:carbohydrate ABC transporter permease [Clostridia bacterium]